MSWKVYRCPGDTVVIDDGEQPRESSAFSWDELFQHEAPADYVASVFDSANPAALPSETSQLPPIGTQEVWAAGVTYFRSRTARMEEAETSGGDVFYDKVYDADRPELFFKSTSSRARGTGDHVCIRKDSTWDVPEPELTLAINSSGNVFGYTVGNDMSSRSIEGENPLYLPQAKMYAGSCAIGPCLLITPSLSESTEISLVISRDGEAAFSGTIPISQIKRDFGELAEYLFRSNEFPCGAYLMTGTGIVPDSDFTLKEGDEVAITIQGIGTLSNSVISV